MKFKYNDKVRVIRDEENNGFYLGLEGRLVSYNPKTKRYGMEMPGTNYEFMVLEDDIELVQPSK